MILTCPACDTKYVVKDDAIPPGGRQVRCAACKHSWHQDPEPLALTEADEAAADFGGPPPPSLDHVEPVAAEAPAEAQAEAMIAEEPQPLATAMDEPAAEARPTDAADVMGAAADEVAMEEAPAIADDWRVTTPAEELPQPADGPAPAAEEEFIGYAPIDEDEERPRRRWPLILGLLILIVAAASAFWYFAPPEWKARAGLADAGATPLQLMITTRERQPLASGNELVVISGRIINPTDREQNVPPIQAELRSSQSNAIVHRWTITPPLRQLGPGKSTNFNSAEVDEARSGDQLLLSIRLGG